MLFKISKGLAKDLPTSKTPGHMWLTQDDGKLYVDISDSERICLNDIPTNLYQLLEDESHNSVGVAYYYNGAFYEESAHTNQITPTTNRIYFDLTEDKVYRYDGSSYTEVGSLKLGETATTAYRGDRGKIAYDHSQTTHARVDATKTESSTTNGNIKINGTETAVYTHPTQTAQSAGLYKITTDGTGHVTAATTVEKSDITGLGIPSQDTTYTVETAVSGGTDESLVTTGEKFDWNEKANVIEITQAEYDAMSQTEKNADIVYLISDSPENPLDLSEIFGDFASIEYENTALNSYAANDYLIYDNKFYKVTTSIAQGDTIIPGTNVIQTTVGDEFKNRLSISGGYVGGSINCKLDYVDGSKANNDISATLYPTTSCVLDKDNRILSRLETVIESNGNISGYWYCRNYNTSGTQLAQKGIKMLMDKSGNFSYNVDDPNKFMSAIGGGNLVIQQWFNVTPPSKTSGGKTNTVTVPSGYKLLVSQPVGDYISGAGQVYVTDKSVSLSGTTATLSYYLYNPQNVTANVTYRGSILLIKSL